MTNKGRVDFVVSTRTHTYVFELKLNASPEVALAQIKDRGYYERSLHKGKQVCWWDYLLLPRKIAFDLRVYKNQYLVKLTYFACLIFW